MYLVGIFQELKDDMPFNEVKIVDEITREDLLKSKQDSDYMIVDIKNLKFFHPDKNEWLKLNAR